MTGPLSKPEWDAVLHQAPAGVKHLVYKLAIHHEAIEPSEPEQCPICRTRRREPEQRPLELSA